MAVPGGAVGYVGPVISGLDGLNVSVGSSWFPVVADPLEGVSVTVTVTQGAEPVAPDPPLLLNAPMQEHADE